MTYHGSDWTCKSIKLMNKAFCSQRRPNALIEITGLVWCILQYLLQRSPHLLVCILLQRVKVLPDATMKQERILQESIHLEQRAWENAFRRLLMWWQTADGQAYRSPHCLWKHVHVVALKTDVLHSSNMCIVTRELCHAGTQSPAVVESWG